MNPCKGVINKMKSKYEMECDDGFYIQSYDKNEAAGSLLWHIMMKHPNMKMSMEEAMKKVKVANDM